MQTINSNLLKELTTIQGEPCISIYMPTHRFPPSNSTDPITFKNIYKKIQQYIRSNGLVDYENLLQSLEKLMEDKAFWKNNQEGLAIFAYAKELRILQLPEKVQESIYIAKSLCVKPLFKLLQENRSYYLLALALDEVRLYRGDKYNMEDLHIEDRIPTSMKEALGEELTDNHLHASVVVGAGLHGYMEKSQEEDIDMDRFFRKIDQAILQHYPIPPDIPLFLLTLPEHQTHFRRISKHQNFAEMHLDISPQAISKPVILEKMRHILDQLLDKQKKDLLERFELAASDNLSSLDIGDIVRDAIDGKVELLCLEEDKSINGHIDIEKRTVVYNTRQYTDIVNDIACIVFDYGGQVVTLKKEEMPHQADLFTINRYK